MNGRRLSGAALLALLFLASPAAAFADDRSDDVESEQDDDSDDRDDDNRGDGCEAVEYEWTFVDDGASSATFNIVVAPASITEFDWEFDDHDDDDSHSRRSRASSHGATNSPAGNWQLRIGDQVIASLSHTERPGGTDDDRMSVRLRHTMGGPISLTHNGAPHVPSNGIFTFELELQPDVCAPPPAVPEVPLAVLLPVSALGVFGIAGMTSRRRLNAARR